MKSSWRDLFFSSPEVSAARQGLAAEAPGAVALREATRAHWDAAERLTFSDASAASTAISRLAIHRAALEQVLTAWVPDAAGEERLARLTEAQRHVLAPAPNDLSALTAFARGAAPELAWAEAAHQRVLDTLEANLRVVRRHQLARRAIVGLALIGIAGGVLGAGLVVKKLTAPTDLASGKPFTLSSKWADCQPDKGRCGGYPTRVLFHTNEEKNPWFQLDLGAPTTFSKVFVQNRSDMARMRAVPLVLEVSDDGQTFKALGRRDDRFDTFTYEFPATTARYVRLRVDRISVLHLEAVKVWK